MHRCARPWRSGFLLALVGLFASTGCGSDALSSPTAVRLRALGGLYLEYAINISRNRQGPAREEEFKKYVQGLPDFKLEDVRLDRDSLDTLWTSERDGQPFVIVCGVSIHELSGDRAPLVAHERTGKNGKRLVAYANGKVEEVDDDRFRELTTAGP